MKTKFNVSVFGVEQVHELPDSWSEEQLRGLLELAEFDGWETVEEGELKDYVIMALQDMEADEAAQLVLKYQFGTIFKAGLLESMAHEMMEEKLWEEYKDINLHAALYNGAVMLKWAFPRKFPETDAILCKLKVNCSDPKVVWTKSLLIRLLATGMDSHAVVNRLFKDQLLQTSFPEAEGIIWKFVVQKEGDASLITVISSTYWLHDMDNITSFETTLNTE